MQIYELHQYTQAQYNDLTTLMGQLSQRCVFTHEKLMEVIKDINCHLFVIEDEERIIGCATLCVFHSPTGTKASVEDVVVSEDYRGQHLGRKVMEYVLEQAKALSPIELHLTSNPMRVAANKLYQSIGFLRKETNVYQLDI